MSEKPYNYAIVYAFETETSTGTGRCFLARDAALDTADEVVSAEAAIMESKAFDKPLKSLFITNILELKAGRSPTAEP